MTEHAAEHFGKPTHSDTLGAFNYIAEHIYRPGSYEFHRADRDSASILRQFGNAGISETLPGGAVKTDYPSGDTEYSMPDGKSVTVSKDGDITLADGDESRSVISKRQLDSLPPTTEYQDVGGGWRAHRSGDGGYVMVAPTGEVIELDKNGKLKAYTNGDEFRTTIKQS